MQRQEAPLYLPDVIVNRAPVVVYAPPPPNLSRIDAGTKPQREYAAFLLEQYEVARNGGRVTRVRGYEQRQATFLRRPTLTADIAAFEGKLQSHPKSEQRIATLTRLGFPLSPTGTPVVTTWETVSDTTTLITGSEPEKDQQERQYPDLYLVRTGNLERDGQRTMREDLVYAPNKIGLVMYIRNPNGPYSRSHLPTLKA